MAARISFPTLEMNLLLVALFVLSSKLKILKDKLKIWNKEVFGNIHSYVNEAEKKLEKVQEQIQQQGHNVVVVLEEKKAQTKSEEALHRQEIYWQEKARVGWHLNGDRKSKYFHRVTKLKNKTKIISNIRHNDEIISEPLRIADHIVSYYKILFVSTNIVLQNQFLIEEVIL